MEPEHFELTIKFEMYKQDSRGVLPDPTDTQAWQDLFVDWIDNMDGVPVCTDTGHVHDNGEAFICGQHVSLMEDSEWRIASVTVEDA